MGYGCWCLLLVDDEKEKEANNDETVVVVVRWLGCVVWLLRLLGCVVWLLLHVVVCVFAHRYKPKMSAYFSITTVGT